LVLPKVLFSIHPLRLLFSDSISISSQFSFSDIIDTILPLEVVKMSGLFSPRPLLIFEADRTTETAVVF